jgi:hypothetical protein
MRWELTTRADRRCAALADRHYSRQKVGSAQFMPPGGCVVLYAGRPGDGEAVWGTSTPFAEYVKHEWAGAWMCSIFRNEGAGLATDLIKEAIAATRAVVGDPPTLGLVTFINRKHVKPFISRKRSGAVRAIYGQTYRQAGFREVGETKGGLLALQMLPTDMPDPVEPHGFQGTFYLDRRAS